MVVEFIIPLDNIRFKVNVQIVVIAREDQTEGLSGRFPGTIFAKHGLQANDES